MREQFIGRPVEETIATDFCGVIVAASEVACNANVHSRGRRGARLEEFVVDNAATGGCLLRLRAVPERLGRVARNGPSPRLKRFRSNPRILLEVVECGDSDVVGIFSSIALSDGALRGTQTLVEQIPLDCEIFLAQGNQVEEKSQRHKEEEELVAFQHGVQV